MVLSFLVNILFHQAFFVFLYLFKSCVFWIDFIKLNFFFSQQRNKTHYCSLWNGSWDGGMLTDCLGTGAQKKQQYPSISYSCPQEYHHQFSKAASSEQLHKSTSLGMFFMLCFQDFKSYWTTFWKPIWCCILSYMSAGLQPLASLVSQFVFLNTE